MSYMAGQYFQGSDLMSWPLLALVLFIAVFGFAIFRLVRRGAAPFEELARLPLDNAQREDRHEA